jgi:hypothetical protein
VSGLYDDGRASRQLVEVRSLGVAFDRLVRGDMVARRVSRWGFSLPT